MTVAAPAGRVGAEEARDQAVVLGCRIDRLDLEETVRRCEALVAAGRPAQHVVVNAAKLVLLREDERLRRIVEACEIVNADGQAVVWAARLLGDPLPARVAGIDLMHRLLAVAAEKGHRVFLLGARREVLDEVQRRLGQLHPSLQVVGARDGYFTDAEAAGVCDEIRAARADMLFVAMPSPKKEYWLAEHGPDLGVPFMMGVGGSFDVLAGVTRRAPRWAQRAGLEWLFRLVQEPRRLARRYLTSNLRFLVLLGRELLTRRGRRAR
jgi:N-acetylglucosaminyldiphosphoundecaprenol N-acetyl-beta-D-mannosaminyltransferase